ncbi:MAG: alpha/beta fold hydrolase BchO, partial [Pseudomonadota bacterium]
LAGPEDAPGLLMLHGLGGAGHSFRDLIEPLSTQFRVVVPDLPGHGFSSRPGPGGMALPAQARALAALTMALGVVPMVGLAHSAGAAVLARMAIDGPVAPRALVAVNGAFLPFPGLAAVMAPSLARLLALNPAVPRAVAFGAVADPLGVERLIVGTGSRIDAAGLGLYRRLIACPGHVSAALAMMAAWQLEPLYRDLPRLSAALMLAIGTADRAVPPRDAERVAERLPSARIERLAGLGHLAHEEAPERVAALVVETARLAGVLPANAAVPAAGRQVRPSRALRRRDGGGSVP